MRVMISDDDNMTTSEQKMGRVLTVKLQISAAVESLQRYCCRNDTVVYGLRHVSSVYRHRDRRS